MFTITVQKVQQFGSTMQYCVSNAAGKANSVYPDQTAP